MLWTVGFFLMLMTNPEILTNHSKVSCQSLLKIGILECKSFNKKNKFFIVIGWLTHVCDLEKWTCNFVPDIRPFKVVRLSVYGSVNRFSGTWMCTHSKKSICYHFLFNACFPLSLDHSALFLSPPPSNKN